MKANGMILRVTRSMTSERRGPAWVVKRLTMLSQLVDRFVQIRRYFVRQLQAVHFDIATALCIELDQRAGERGIGRQALADGLGVVVCTANEAAAAVRTVLAVAGVRDRLRQRARLADAAAAQPLDDL